MFHAPWYTEGAAFSTSVPLPVLVMPVFCPPATRPLSWKLPLGTFNVAPKFPIVTVSPVEPLVGRLTTAPVRVIGPPPSDAPDEALTIALVIDRPLYELLALPS